MIRPPFRHRSYRPIVGRVFFCHNCPARCGGDHGVFRLRWLLLFFFCDDCWQHRREQCEKLMAGACSLPPKASDTGRDGAHVVPAHASGGAL
jgi:hypothetical protein